MKRLCQIPTELVRARIKDRRGWLGQLNGRLASVGRPATQMVTSELSQKAPLGALEAGMDSLR